MASKSTDSATRTFRLLIDGFATGESDFGPGASDDVEGVDVDSG